MATAAENKLVTALGTKLAPLGPFQARPMFGGFGLYIDGAIFGLIASGQVFLKADDQNRATFEAAGSTPFRYVTTRGEKTSTGYWLCPDAVLRDATKLQLWVTGSLAARRRALLKKPARKKTVGKPSRQRNPFL